MRNWNYIDILKVTNQEQRFSSYLWGIETCLVSCREHTRPTRFHLTYEELKLMLSPLARRKKYSPFSSYLWGIETVPGQETVTENGVSFHLTYEELKPRTNQPKSQHHRVFILPMRNWNNISLKTCLSVLFMFSSYLWGIETCSKSLIWSLNFCFHLTYEELKHSSLSFSKRSSSVFILPMRNWNSPGGGKRSSSVQVFILPMRNWNYSQLSWFPFSTAVFILPMRNWNRQRLPRSRLSPQ